jgi:hypothetical protein
MAVEITERAADAVKVRRMAVKVTRIVMFD